MNSIFWDLQQRRMILGYVYFYRNLSLGTQSWMISKAVHDVWMVIVPEGILVLDCSYICVWEKLFYMLFSLLSSDSVITLGAA